jgi:mediator of RNA polymerase II transcription subunit 31
LSSRYLSQFLSNALHSPLLLLLLPSPFGDTKLIILLKQFVQSLANPAYLLHLASSNTPNTSGDIPPVPLLTHPPFIAYLSYLQYWSHPPYTKYLTYPGPTLKHLQLLQNERFRGNILRPEIVRQLMEEDIKGAEELHLNGR